jgi:hypothetical protein
MIKARVNNVDFEVLEGTSILFAARKAQAVYRKFLEKPNSFKSHKLLHTHYFKRSTVTISQSRKN